MTRKTSRRKAKMEELVDELSNGAAMRLRCNTADIHGIVRAVVSYLVEEYPAQDLYIPAGLAPGAYPVKEMRAAVAAGTSIRAVCRKFRVSRRTLYRLLSEPTVSFG